MPLTSRLIKGLFALRRTTATASALVAVTALFSITVQATDNVPYRPFAQWADIPEAHQFVVGLVYEQSDAYRIWAGGHSQNVTVNSGGNDYGIAIHQGFVSLQYGIDEKWAADFSMGYTTIGNRYFDPHGVLQTTGGLMDYAAGVRYQIFNEADAQSPWIPTLTFRAGAVMPGTYDQYFPYAPGTRSAGVEPELLLRKHFGWPGLGVYGDALFRWNMTTHNDLYEAAIGLFQQIKGWEIDAGFRHLGTVDGYDVVLGPDYSVNYPREVREIRSTVEAGFSYTSPKRHIRYGFQSATVFNGNNSDAKLWLGASVDIPFGGNPNK